MDVTLLGGNRRRFGGWPTTVGSVIDGGWRVTVSILLGQCDEGISPSVFCPPRIALPGGGARCMSTALVSERWYAEEEGRYLAP